ETSVPADVAEAGSAADVTAPPESPIESPSAAPGSAPQSESDSSVHCPATGARRRADDPVCSSRAPPPSGRRAWRGPFLCGEIPGRLACLVRGPTFARAERSRAERAGNETLPGGAQSEGAKQAATGARGRAAAEG